MYSIRFRSLRDSCLIQLLTKKFGVVDCAGLGTGTIFVACRGLNFCLESSRKNFESLCLCVVKRSAEIVIHLWLPDPDRINDIS